MSATLSHPIPIALHDLEHSLKDLISEALLPNKAHGEKPSSKTDVKEGELVKALCNGVEVAFHSLIDQYNSRLIRMARAYVPSEAVAEEVVQETWLGVLEGIRRFEGRSSLKTWIFKILINRAKTKGQRENKYISFTNAFNRQDQEKEGAMESEWFHSAGPMAGHWVTPPTAWEEGTPERLLLSKEGLGQIERAIQALPPNFRQVMILRAIEGISSKEVCDMLRITPTNQRVRLHRGRSKVRAILNQYFHEHSTLTGSTMVIPGLLPV